MTIENRRTIASCSSLIVARVVPVCTRRSPPTASSTPRAEPQNWLTYTGDYTSQRYSALTQITPANVEEPRAEVGVAGPGVRRLAVDPARRRRHHVPHQRPNDVMALDAKTGRVFWLYRYTPAPTRSVCCGANNRGVAILGDTLFMGTLDAHLVAIDAKNGTAALEHRGRRREAGVLDHARAARREGQGDRRRRRRRVRHPRLHRRVRREDRQGSLALLHDSRPGRAGARDVARRRLEARRRRRSG